MEEKALLNEETLEDVSGGYLHQTREVADFINAHGGHVRYDENMRSDIISWFREADRYKKIGMTNAYFSTNNWEENFVNTYKDGVGRHLSHESFMRLLHETFD